MMPGAIADRHITTVTVEAVAAIDVTDLTGAERTVALYVSDMPNQRRRHTKEQLAAWIAQGVERLGLDEVRQQASFYAGHRALECSRVVTVPVQALHEQRFPKQRRLEWASQMSANLIYHFPPTDEAVARSRDAVEVDGGCPCRGTGDIDVWRGDPDVSCSMMCPVHRRAEIDAFHRGYRAGI
ncbi:hypothetical protein [Streptomyces griseofuscus]|uniref:hypothetical protein n=1 Tax=Streptomyces griseofuscus TaxID=146922 RepID=UPI00382A91C7